MKIRQKLVVFIYKFSWIKYEMNFGFKWKMKRKLGWRNPISLVYESLKLIKLQNQKLQLRHLFTIGVNFVSSARLHINITYLLFVMDKSGEDGEDSLEKVCETFLKIAWLIFAFENYNYPKMFSVVWLWNMSAIELINSISQSHARVIWNSIVKRVCEIVFENLFANIMEIR